MNMTATTQTQGRILVWILFLLPIIPVIVFFTFPNFIKRNFTFFENEPPSIDIAALPSVVGLEPVRLPIIVQDDGAGLDEVIIRVEQGGKRTDLFNRKAPAPGEQLEGLLNARELALREGTATLLVSAFDKSFWSNTAEVSKEIRISYSRPRLEVLTSQHNVALGGTTLVLYRILSGEMARSGIMVAGHEQLGYPASRFDPAFASEPTIHGALIAVPKSFNPDSDKLEAFAVDIAGNIARAAMNYRILRRKFPDAPITLREEFLRSRLADLWPKYQAMANGQELLDSATATEEELARGFARINEDFRGLLETKIRQSSSSLAGTQGWLAPLRRPMLGSPTSQFGEQRRYSFLGREISRSEHDGIDLAAVANTVVRAPAPGVVTYADDLGIYGQTVVIDHGLGLSTLYGHLASISVGVGDSVSIDQALGRTGVTGLAAGDHLHFEVRVQGISVTPIEWWDTKWVQDHIQDKIGSIKRLLALEAQQQPPTS